MVRTDWLNVSKTGDFVAKSRLALVRVVTVVSTIAMQVSRRDQSFDYAS